MDVRLDEAALAAIGEGAAEAEQEQAGGVADEVVLSDAQKWAALPQVLGSVLCIALPELKAAYSPENCQTWGESMVPLAEKHGWSPDAAVGPELGMVVASLPMVVPTVLVVMQRRAAALQAARARMAEQAAKDAKTAPSDVAQVLNPAPPATPDPASPAVKLEQAGVFGV